MRIPRIGAPDNLDVAPFLVGLISLPAQALLCRELLARGGGNEIVLTLYLSLWLAGSAVGALFWGARASRHPRSRLMSSGALLIAAPVAAAVALAVARFLPNLGSRAGEIPHPAAIGLAGILVLFPVAFVSAGLFPLAARGEGSGAAPRESNGDAIRDGEGRGATRSTGRAYIWEALGALVGGCATTAAVMLRIPPLEIVTLVTAAATALAFPRLKGLIAASILAAIAIMGMSTRLDDALFRAAWSAHHPGLHLASHATTPTRTLALASREGERWLLADDAPREVLDDPYRDEATAALLLAAPPVSPRSILLVDFGASGVARALEQAVGPGPRQLTQAMALGSAVARVVVPRATAPQSLPRIACLVPDREDTILVPPVRGTTSIVGDPRRSLRHVRPGWDLIAISSSEGTSIAANRLWTTEAFREMAGRLAPHGVIVAIAPGGDAAPGPEARAWRESVAAALARATGGAPAAIDADRFILVASARPGEASLDPDSLTIRYTRAGARLATYPAARFAVEYPRDRQVRFGLFPGIRINSDARPAAFAYAIGRWLRLSGIPAPPRALLIVLAVTLVAIPVSVIAISSGTSRTGESADVRRPIPTSVSARTPLEPADVRRSAASDARLGIAALLATGATSMGLDLLVLMTYQARVGMLQGGLGALLGAFLGGTAIGASVKRAGLTTLCFVQAIIAVAAAVLLPHVPATTIVFAFLAFILGATCGAPFPIAARAIGPGRAWSADAVGGILGALLFLIVVSQGIVIAGLVLALPPLLVGAGILLTSTTRGSLDRTSGSARP